MSRTTARAGRIGFATFTAILCAAAATTAEAQSCAQVRAVLARGFSIEDVAIAAGRSMGDIQSCIGRRGGIRRNEDVHSLGAPGPPPLGAAGPAPHGAPGRAPLRAAGPPPRGAAGPAPRGAAGPAPFGAAGPAPSAGKRLPAFRR